jgi:hypothetical protein
VSRSKADRIHGKMPNLKYISTTTDIHDIFIFIISHTSTLSIRYQHTATMKSSFLLALITLLLFLAAEAGNIKDIIIYKPAA